MCYRFKFLIDKIFKKPLKVPFGIYITIKSCKQSIINCNINNYLYLF